MVTTLSMGSLFFTPSQSATLAVPVLSLLQLSVINKREIDCGSNKKTLKETSLAGFSGSQSHQMPPQILINEYMWIKLQFSISRQMFK